MTTGSIDAGLALDFDGVVWDSVGECYEVGWRAWQEMGGPGLPVTPEIEAAFREARPWVRTGQDFYVVLRFLQEGRADELARLTTEDYAAARERWVEPARVFDRHFYGMRETMRDRDFSTWSSWQRAYPGVPEAIRELRRTVRVIGVTTTKDEGSTRKLLDTVGLDLEILGKEHSRDKTVQIQTMAERHGLPASRILLLDDLLENLEMARRAGAGGAMASWGYNTPEGRAETSRAGYPMVDIARIVPEVTALLSMRVEGGG